MRPLPPMCVVSEDGGDAVEDSVHNPDADEDSREEQPCNGYNSECFDHGVQSIRRCQGWQGHQGEYLEISEPSACRSA